MSARNGDKSRYGRLRKERIARREKNRVLKDRVRAAPVAGPGAGPGAGRLRAPARPDRAD